MRRGRGKRRRCDWLRESIYFFDTLPKAAMRWREMERKMNKSIKQLNNEGGEEKERDLKEAKETYEQ